MELDVLLSLIANTGFPIVVASYFILRMESRLEELTASIQSLQETIGHLKV